MRELKPCPFCGSTDIRLIEGDEYCWCMNQRCPIYDYEIRIDKWESRSESLELAALREQVKVLREALGWLVNEMDCRDDEFGGCLFTRQDFRIARDALAQTKPKEGE